MFKLRIRIIKKGEIGTEELELSDARPWEGCGRRRRFLLVALTQICQICDGGSC